MARSTTTPGHPRRTTAAAGANHSRCKRGIGAKRVSACCARTFLYNLVYIYIFSILSRPCRKISLTLNIHWNCHRTLKSSIISSEIQPSAWSIAALFLTPGRSAWIFRLYPFPSKSFWRGLTQLIWSLCSAPSAPGHPIFKAVFCFSGEVSPTELPVSRCVLKEIWFDTFPSLVLTHLPLLCVWTVKHWCESMTLTQQ